MASLEGERPLNDILKADEGELGELVDLIGVAHDGDEV
jgi:hypothetical protein